MGRYFAKSFVGPLLCTGITFESFKTEEMDSWIRRVRRSVIIEPIILSIVAEIASGSVLPLFNKSDNLVPYYWKKKLECHSFCPFQHHWATKYNFIMDIIIDDNFLR